MSSIKRWGFMTLLLVGAVSHAEFGVGLSGYSWEMDKSDMQKNEDYFKGFAPFIQPAKFDLSHEHFSGEVTAFYEREITERLGWGVQGGFWASPKAESSVAYSNSSDFDTGEHLENTAISFPLSVYLRRTADSYDKISFLAGAGVEYIKAKATFDFWDPSESQGGTFKDEKLAPFLQLGVDCKVAKRVSFGFSLKQLFQAELNRFEGTMSGSPGKTRLVMKEDPGIGQFIDNENSGIPGSTKPYKVDFGGLRVGFNAKVYFGG